MVESTRSLSSNSPPTSSARSWRPWLFLSVVATVLVALLLVQLDTFNAAPYPSHELAKKPMLVAPRTNPRVLHGSEKMGEGRLLGPEDIVFNAKLGVIYTSCGDGWIKRVRVNDSMVEDWVITGGRPLGLALGYSEEVYVDDAFKVSL